MNQILEYTELQSLKNRKIVNNYFRAWQNYDITLIKRIFDYNATYRIIKHIPKTYLGIDSVIDYWERNKNRQAAIRINYRIKSISGSIVYVVFKAYFFDVEERQDQLVSGFIEFKIRKNQIVSLKENYKKQILSICQETNHGKRLRISSQVPV